MPELKPQNIWMQAIVFAKRILSDFLKVITSTHYETFDLCPFTITSVGQENGGGGNL